MQLKFLISIFTITLFFSSCNLPEPPNRNIADSGVKKASASVKTGVDNLTEEQRNVKEYLEYSNTPGAIKHLYVVSVYSGDVLLYSPVRGKVTSSGKRLTSNMTVTQIDRGTYYTDHVMGRIGDDGTYGGANSSKYIYWKDTKDEFHKHFVTGGQMIHVSETPMNFPKVIVNVDPSWGTNTVRLENK
jgi:hypothetical protein